MASADAAERQAERNRSSSGSGSSGSDSDFIDALERRRREQEQGGDIEEEFGNEFFWQEAVLDRIYADIKAVAKAYDMDTSTVEAWFSGQQVNLIKYVQGAIDRGGHYLSPNNPGGMAAIFNVARQWVGIQFPAFQEAFLNIPSSGGSGGRGRGGGGSGRPTAAQIRAQFDIDQLTNAVNQMSRGLLLEEADNARSLATSYVNAIVANPEQELDFETFVRGKLMNSARAKMIYANKPKALSEEQFLQPYIQAAQQMIGPGEGDQLADVAIGGARMGADPNAFRKRLERTSQVRNSAPYLNKLSQRMNGFRTVLRG